MRNTLQTRLAIVAAAGGACALLACFDLLQYTGGLTQTADASAEAGDNPDGGITERRDAGSSLPPDTIAEAQGPVTSVLVNDTHVYWATEAAGGEVRRCPVSGCSGAPVVMATAQGVPRNLILARTFLFWGTNTARMFSSPLLSADAGLPERDCDQNFKSFVFGAGIFVGLLQSGSYAVGCADNYPFLIPDSHSLIVDPSGRTTYFLAGIGPHALFRSLTGGATGTSALLTSLDGFRIQALAADDQRVFATLSTGRILILDTLVERDASARITLTSDVLARPGSILYADGDLYVAVRGTGAADGRIVRMSKTGADLVGLAEAQKEPANLAITRDWIYWSTVDGAIRRAHR